MTAALVAFQLNTQFVVAFGLNAGLQSPDTSPLWITDGVGQASIYNPDGTLAAGPLTFVYTPGAIVMPNGDTSPDGNYLARLPETFNPPVGASYKCKIEIVSSAEAAQYHVERQTMVQIRTQ